MSDLTLPTPINLEPAQVAALAREMAIAIKDPHHILEAMGVSQAQFDAYVRPSAFYKRAYEAYVVEWESALSTNKRIALQSAAAIEDILPKLSARMSNGQEGLTAVTETAKLLAKLAGIGEEKRNVGEGERFSIVINLGADTTLKFNETIGGAPLIDITPESPSPLLENSQGQTIRPPV